jgi:hypothetical protein
VAKTMTTISDYFCPSENCKCYGLRGQGNLVKAGKYMKVGVGVGVGRQMFKCKSGTPPKIAGDQLI